MRTDSFPSETADPASRRVALFDAIALVRPTLLIPLWTMHLLGAVHADGLRLFWTPSRDFLLLSAAQTCLIAAAYVLNQLTDIASDAENRKLFLLSEGHISRRFAQVEIALLTLFACAFAAIRRTVDGPLALLAATALMGVAYSLPPIRLKARAGWDALANSVGYGGVAFALTAMGELGASAWIASTPYVLSVAATFLLTTIPDIEGDAAANLRTTGVVLGAKRTAWLALALLGGACVAVGVNRDVIALIAVLVALPLFVRSAYRIALHGDDPGVTRTTKAAILALSLIAAFFVPPYAIWLALVILWTRRYYAKRFAMRYP